ncbi:MULTISPECIES: hypothetical protein [unclassified Caballeronia]|uniref:hypothetical protein n=1 Tax=unclassified Caballeronia TaxID=2646786 RepID=UPI002854FCAE|nr:MULTISPECIES: hypothetical protein [unclassified Caballeronia]MDR5755236.1 hypothetical protein [Caballeronia sp. LZ024]MDR5845596.1 hypothetical protein [Caballeronia sp. LZ031]
MVKKPTTIETCIISQYDQCRLEFGTSHRSEHHPWEHANLVSDQRQRVDLCGGDEPVAQAQTAHRDD